LEARGGTSTIEDLGAAQETTWRHTEADRTAPTVTHPISLRHSPPRDSSDSLPTFVRPLLASF